MALNTLPVHTFQINYESDLDGLAYQGLFTCRKKVLSDENKIKIRQIQLCGGYHYDQENPGVGTDQETWAVNRILASLELLLTSKPAWFDMDSLVDFGIVMAVWNEVAKFQNTFRQRPGSQSANSSQTGSSTPAQSTNQPGSAPNMVFAEVQASLEPR